MAHRTTLAEVEQLAGHLSPPERLKLAARICEQLAAARRPGRRGARAARAEPGVDAWLRECDALAESVEGEFDAAADLRAMRSERP